MDRKMNEMNGQNFIENSGYCVLCGHKLTTEDSVCMKCISKTTKRLAEEVDSEFI